MIVLGGWRAGKHFAYEVDDGIAACAKLTDDLEFGSKFSVVCEGCLLGRLVGDETKPFALEGNTLANNVAGREDILYVRGDG
jgi:hypothetical protein